MTMEIEESINMLREHNAWRRGAETEMHDPRKIGEAIDTLIKAVELLVENRTLRAMNDELEKVIKVMGSCKENGCPRI